MKLQTASAKTLANEVLKTKDKTLWYLIIGEESELIINVGEKTFNKANELIEKEKKQKTTK